MATHLLPTITFILISTFSPGPTNIASAAMGVLHGYRKTLPFMLGMVAGFLCLVSLCAWAATAVLHFFPLLQPLLQFIGAGYIIYLAFGMLKASYTFSTDTPGQATQPPMHFGNGFVLQALNPKLVVYGLALFSTFLAPFATRPAQVALIVPLLALVAFVATSVWALGGALIKAKLQYPRVQFAVNLALSLALVYTALTVANFL